jgi:hypothetical protein
MSKARDLANGATALSAVSATELGYVDGVTSAIQTQIDTKAPSSTAVTLTGTQTLTNKTLTSPALTTPTISTATTNGDILYGTGSGALARLGIGSTDQVLKVTGGVPVWATPASGGSTTLLSTTTLAGSTTTVSSISQAYKHLYIEIYGMLPSTFNPTINYQTNSNGLIWNVTQAASGTGVNYYNTSGTVGSSQNYGGNMAGSNKGTMWIYDYTDATYQKNGTFNHWWRNEGGSWIYFNGQLTTGHSTAVTSLSMVISTGTFTSGTIKIYGVN